ncbi:MAG TPA: ABC transporter ATP-binding protein, partial [Phycisphaerales bacterium]|nr:ABC transporter ATP-binding protein [Phycisphaerales bacterium]
FGPRQVLTGIDLVVPPNETLCVIGESGCGKTVLLKLIVGLLRPTEGEVLFEGRALHTLPQDELTRMRLRVGFLFQQAALFDSLTVFDNVAFGLTVRKVEKAETRRRVMEALAMVQMDAFAQRKPNALSGGQQQRVALARALVIRPDVLLLDEPLSNLDAKLRIELRSEIRRICKDAGITGVYVTHDQKEALSMADRCAVMRAGRIVQMGTPHELYHKPGSRFVAEFLGETNFIEGTLMDAGAGGSRVRTGAGELRSAHAPPAGVGPGSPLALSLRPEALRLTWEGGAGGGGSGNTMSGRVVESTYLGEIAQHTVELGEGGAGAARVKVAQLNPGPTLAAGGSAATVTVAPSDVVLLPA